MGGLTTGWNSSAMMNQNPQQQSQVQGQAQIIRPQMRRPAFLPIAAVTEDSRSESVFIRISQSANFGLVESSSVCPSADIGWCC